MISRELTCFAIGLQFLEDDINGHQEMFASLNENGQLIMAEMEPGDVLTAVQAKLDDMNDRCQSHSLKETSTLGTSCH